MFKELTPLNENTKIEEKNIFENVYMSFVVNHNGKMFEKITDGKYHC